MDIETVTPRRAARLMFQLPRDCRTFTALQPAVQWGWSEILSNKIVYLLEVLVWQKSKDAQKKHPTERPKLFTPDFMAAVMDDPKKEIEVHTTDDIQDMLSKPRI